MQPGMFGRIGLPSYTLSPQGRSASRFVIMGLVKAVDRNVGRSPCNTAIQIWMFGAQYDLTRMRSLGNALSISFHIRIQLFFLK